MPEFLSTDDAPRPGGAYSQGVRVGSTLFLSGQLGIDPATGKVREGVAEQTRQALRNLEGVLRSAGGSLESIVKTTCFLVDNDRFAEFNAAYEEVLGSHRPARSTVGVTLPGGFLVEIECIAHVD